MVTPVQSPPLEPAAEAPPPSPPASHNTTNTSIAHSRENPAPPPPPPTQPNLAGGPSPALPPETPTPPPPPNAHASTLSSENQPPAPLPPSADPPPTAPAPESADAKVEPEAAEATGESENLTLALALTLTKDATPPLPPSTAAAVVPNGSPPKETTLTIAKLLSGEDSTAAEVKPPPEKAVAGGNGGAGGGRLGSKRWLLGGLPEKVRRAELRRAELGFRVSAAVLCLVSLSVMAADSTPGWAGDSFHRYNEYRYSLAASVAAFTYSAFQVVSELHYIVTGKHIIGHPWGNYFNLAMDQVLAYLLLSASSAALSRNGVWVSRFGGDQFTKLINVSASMAFLAFIALGLSSIVSAFYVFSSIS